MESTCSACGMGPLVADDETTSGLCMTCLWGPMVHIDSGMERVAQQLRRAGLVENDARSQAMVESMRSSTFHRGS